MHVNHAIPCVSKQSLPVLHGDQYNGLIAWRTVHDGAGCGVQLLLPVGLKETCNTGGQGLVWPQLGTGGGEGRGGEGRGGEGGDRNKAWCDETT